jgi:hypothetical protein
MKNISFLSAIAMQAVNKTIDRKESAIRSFASLLALNGETLADGLLYINKGADYKRKEVLAECEAFIKKNKLPQYEAEPMRKRAYNSLDNKYISDLSEAIKDLTRAQINIETDVVRDNGEIVLSEAVIQEIRQRFTHTLTDEEMKDFVKIRAFCQQAKELSERYVYRGLDGNCVLDLLGTYSEMTDERFAEMMIDNRWK